MDIYEKVYEIVSQIPKGEVMTYGQIAKQIGTSPRVVGNILHKNPDPDKIPCHRVVNARGEVSKNYAFGGKAKQLKKLKAEEVNFFGNRVNLKTCLYSPKNLHFI